MEEFHSGNFYLQEVREEAKGKDRSKRAAEGSDTEEGVNTVNKKLKKGGKKKGKKH